MPGSKGEKMTDEPDWIAAYLLFLWATIYENIIHKNMDMTFWPTYLLKLCPIIFCIEKYGLSKPYLPMIWYMSNFRSFFLDLLPSLFRSLKQIQTRWIRYILKASNIEHDFTYSSETFTFQSNHQLFAIVLHLFFGPCHIGFVPGKSFWNRV